MVFDRLQEKVEPGLPEMTVTGQDVRDSLVGHYDKGDTIGQRPVFVEAPGIQTKPPCKKFFRCRNDFYPWVFRDLLNQTDRNRPLAPFGKCIRHFCQNPSGCDQRSIFLRRRGNDPCVGVVRRIQGSQEEKRVNENRLHRLGVP